MIPNWLPGLWRRKSTIIAAFSIGAIISHLLLRFVFQATPETCRIPLLATLLLGGLPMLYDLKPQTWNWWK
jgi:hypothetical protein